MSLPHDQSKSRMNNPDGGCGWICLFASAHAHAECDDLRHQIGRFDVCYVGGMSVDSWSRGVAIRQIAVGLVYTNYIFTQIRICKCVRMQVHACMHTYMRTFTYRTISYHTIPYHTIPYHTIPYHTIPYHTIPYETRSDQTRLDQTIQYVHAYLDSRCKSLKHCRRVLGLF